MQGLGVDGFQLLTGGTKHLAAGELQAWESRSENLKCEIQSQKIIQGFVPAQICYKLF